MPFQNPTNTSGVGSDVDISEIQSGSKTGSDNKLVTGTEGTNGNLSQWNGDGDLVDASIAASDVQLQPSEGAFADGDKTKLDGIATGAIANVSEDTTPELGGDLNAGANTIYFTENDEGNTSTALTIDWGLGNKAKATWNGNVTFSFTDPSGPCNLTLQLLNDGTGGHTVAWPASVKWNSGAEPTWSTTANETNIVSFYYDGTNYFGDGWTES